MGCALLVGGAPASTGDLTLLVTIHRSESTTATLASFCWSALCHVEYPPVCGDSGILYNTGAANRAKVTPAFSQLACSPDILLQHISGQPQRFLVHCPAPLRLTLFDPIGWAVYTDQ